MQDDGIREIYTDAEQHRRALFDWTWMRRKAVNKNGPTLPPENLCGSEKMITFLDMKHGRNFPLLSNRPESIISPLTNKIYETRHGRQPEFIATGNQQHVDEEKQTLRKIGSQSSRSESVGFVSQFSWC